MPDPLLRLRIELVREEAEEFAAAAAARDLVYVAYGAAEVFGIDMDAVIAEVHASNMTKQRRPASQVDPSAGGARAEAGKLAKGPDYRPPDIAAVLAAQAQRPTRRGEVPS